MRIIIVAAFAGVFTTTALADQKMTTAVNAPAVTPVAATTPPPQLVVKKSSFAVVTGREGVASGLAHRHIVVASDPAVSLTLTFPQDVAKSQLQLPSGGSADIKVKVKSLIVDDVDASESIRGLLVERGIWNATADKVEPSVREKVTENMLDSSQLDEAHFPTISGTGTFTDCQPSGTQTATCKLHLTVTIRGTDVSKDLDLKLSRDADGTTARFVGTFKFTEFGIKPYSAMLGAIRVSDEFSLAAILRAE